MGFVPLWLGAALAALGQAAHPPAKGVPPSDRLCGAYCLSIGLDGLGLAPPGGLGELERRLKPPGPFGYSMLELDDGARACGAKTIAVRTSVENLRARPERFVCIARLDREHYVLLYDIDERSAYVVDYPRSYRLSLDTLGSVWRGEALLMGREPLLPEEVITARRSRNIKPLPALALALVAAFGIVVGVRAIRRRRVGGMVAPSSAAILAVLVGVAGCGRSGPGSVPAPEGVGHLVIENPRIDLGVVRVALPGEHRDVEVVLRNAGTGPLAIDGLTLSCTCTETKLSTKRIEPGSSANLKATIRLGETLGPRGSRITVHSSDPDAPAADIAIEWQIRNPLTVAVPSLRFAPVLPEATATERLPILLSGFALCPECSVNVKADDRFLLCRLTPRDIGRAASHGPTAEQGGDVTAAELEVTTQPASDPQVFNQSITLSVECRGETVARSALPVAWQVAPRVGVTPSRLSLGRQPRKERVSRRLDLRSMEGRDFRVLGVTCADPEALAGAEFEGRADLAHTLRLDFALPEGEGAWRTVVSIRTDHPEAGTLALPVSAILADPDAE